MSAYLDFWRCYADFQGKTSRRSFLLAVVFWGFFNFLLLMTLSIVAMLAFHFEPESAADVGRTVSAVYGMASMVPMIAICIRRLRDAGYSAKSLCWLLIPVLGGFAFLARLLTPSKYENSK